MPLPARSGQQTCLGTRQSFGGCPRGGLDMMRRRLAEGKVENIMHEGILALKASLKDLKNIDKLLEVLLEVHYCTTKSSQPATPLPGRRSPPSSTGHQHPQHPQTAAENLYTPPSFLVLRSNLPLNPGLSNPTSNFPLPSSMYARCSGLEQMRYALLLPAHR